LLIKPDKEDVVSHFETKGERRESKRQKAKYGHKGGGISHQIDRMKQNKFYSGESKALKRRRHITISIKGQK